MRRESDYYNVVQDYFAFSPNEAIRCVEDFHAWCYWMRDSGNPDMISYSGEEIKKCIKYYEQHFDKDKREYA